MITYSCTIGGKSYTGHLDPQTDKLKEIIGGSPEVSLTAGPANTSFVNGKAITFSGGLITINDNIGNVYKISPSRFSKTIDFTKEIEGDGMIEGKWNETAKKLAKLYFAKAKEGSIIYVNDKPHTISRKKDEGTTLTPIKS